MIAALMQEDSPKPILVCTFQNETADLLYEALDKFECIRDITLRVYSNRIARIKREYNEPCQRNSYHILLAEKELQYRLGGLEKEELDGKF